MMKRFSASYVFPLDGTGPIRNGFVEVDDDGAVIRTGACSDPSSEEDFMQGCAIVPGFVNAHCHLELSYMKGLFRKGTGMAGFIDQINALRDTQPAQQKISLIRRWIDIMYERGVVAMGDISNCDDSFAVKASSPMYTRTFLEVFGTEPEDCRDVIDSVKALQEKASAFGLDAAPCPHSCYTMCPRLIEASASEGLRSGFLSFHCEESPQEGEMIRYGRGEMYDNRLRAGMTLPPVVGKSPLLYFIDRLLSVHPAPFRERILLVHEVCMDAEGVEAVKAVMEHPFVALCPMSNIFIHNALPPVELLRGSGIPLTIGTDSLSSNDDLDMVREMFCLQENFDLPLEELLEWACLNGADLLDRKESLGSLEKGKTPGIVLISHISADGRLTSGSKSHLLV